MTEKLQYITAAIVLALLGAVTILWSWNTLAGLFDGPEMQAKHAIAALLLLGVARQILFRRRRPHGYPRIHTHEN